ncbi:MAG: alginate lyase family protein [Planctomycetes bacterium]|nr:alginate lyase family protein [Planctomycetota bacterium]
MSTSFMKLSGGHLRVIWQEVRELGVSNALYRASWEARVRLGLIELLDKYSPLHTTEVVPQSTEPKAVPFGWASAVVSATRPFIPENHLEALLRRASDACKGQVRCFGGWTADFGDPIDWQLNPASTKRWTHDRHWSRVLEKASEIGDVKLTWEVGRFPQAYDLGRASAFWPECVADFRAAFWSQFLSFTRSNPWPLGIHWHSGQEIAFRFMSWLFAWHTLAPEGDAAEWRAAFAKAAQQAGAHLMRYISFARRAVPNNHVLTEAVGLYVISRAFPSLRGSEQWRHRAMELLDEQAERQVFRDGAYIQNSHNYHRLAMQVYLWAWAWHRSEGLPPATWRRAMERSLDFLVAHQNPDDGRLPNYGANDGGLPSILSACDFSDFRPVLQALSIAVRGERIYERGLWDEEAAWLLGPEFLNCPLRPPQRRSVSFAGSGYHVLRDKSEGNFAAFRCGSVGSRFSQMDMLHVDVWWRGLNVLVDGGSYLYNGPSEWHEYFFRTGSHNTIQVDGREQMVHARRFKTLYWTRGKMTRFDRGRLWTLCAGEHYGFRKYPGGVVHRRSLLLVEGGLCIVVDHVTGEGSHRVRLHWLCGSFPWQQHGSCAGLTLATPQGSFEIQIVDERGASVPGDVVEGGESPPRGWLSRYYGERRPVPSLVAPYEGALPVTFISVLSGGSTSVHVEDNHWRIEHSDKMARFDLLSGELGSLSVEAVA